MENVKHILSFHSTQMHGLLDVYFVVKISTANKNPSTQDHHWFLNRPTYQTRYIQFHMYTFFLLNRLMYNAQCKKSNLLVIRLLLHVSDPSWKKYIIPIEPISQTLQNMQCRRSNGYIQLRYGNTRNFQTDNFSLRTEQCTHVTCFFFSF